MASDGARASITPPNIVPHDGQGNVQDIVAGIQKLLNKLLEQHQQEVQALTSSRNAKLITPVELPLPLKEDLDVTTNEAAEIPYVPDERASEGNRKSKKQKLSRKRSGGKVDRSNEHAVQDWFPVGLRYNIQKRIREHKRRVKKEAKKLGLKKRAELLAEIEAKKAKREEELAKKKQEAKNKVKQDRLEQQRQSQELKQQKDAERRKKRAEQATQKKPKASASASSASAPSGQRASLAPPGSGEDEDEDEEMMEEGEEEEDFEDDAMADD